VFQGSVGREDGVVWLDDGAAHLRRRVHAEFELRFLAIIGGEAFHQKSAKAGTSSATERVENEEALETRAVICQSPELVDADVDDLLSNSVVTTGIVVRRVLLARHQSLRVKQGAVSASLDLVDDVGLQVNVKRARDMLSGPSFREERRETRISL